MSEYNYLEHKKRDDGEIIEYGDRGESRPKSRGRVYAGKGDFPTDQTAQDAVDINHVMKRYEKTGKLAELIEMGAQAANGAFYGDFSNPVDFQEALQISIHAQEQFNKLDAPIRNRFDNDPTKFLEFMADDKNREEHYKMGLRIKPEEKPKETTLADIDKTLRETRGGKNTKAKGGESEE